MPGIRRKGHDRTAPSASRMYTSEDVDPVLQLDEAHAALGGDLSIEPVFPRDVSMTRGTFLGPQAWN